MFGPAVDADVLGLAHRARAEARARAVGDAQVEGRAEDGDVGAGELVRVSAMGTRANVKRDAGEAEVGVPRMLVRRHARIMPGSRGSSAGAAPRRSAQRCRVGLMPT